MMALQLTIFAGMMVLVSPCTCPPGTFMERPCHCLPCPNNTYMTEQNNASQCLHCKTRCEPSKTITRPCTKTQDMVCECPKGQYFHTGLLFCMDCDVCPVGHGTEVRCWTESNTICKPCIPEITFSDSERMSSCENCTICGMNSLTVRKCNITTDALCAKQHHTTPKTFTTETHSTTSSRQAVSRAHRKEFVVPLLTVLLFLLVCFVIGVGITLYRRYRNRGGFEQPISIEDRDCDEVIVIEAKPNFVPPRQSGLRGRHTRHPSRRKPTDSNGSTEATQDQKLPNSDQLLRDVPYPVIENLALKLNPRGLNNWMRLAGQLKYSKEKLDYFGMTPDNATQRLLCDWQTSNTSTVGVLYKHLRNIDRDDAAQILETAA